MNIAIPKKHHLPLAYFLMLLVLMYQPVLGCQYYYGGMYNLWVAWLLIGWVGWVLAIEAMMWFFNKVDEKKETE